MNAQQETVDANLAVSTCAQDFDAHVTMARRWQEMEKVVFVRISILACFYHFFNFAETHILLQYIDVKITMLPDLYQSNYICCIGCYRISHFQRLLLVRKMK